MRRELGLPVRAQYFFSRAYLKADANFTTRYPRVNLALPTVSLANGIYTISSNNALQPGQAYTQGSAGGTFGLLRQTVIRDVGLGTSGQPLNSESLHVYIYRLRAKLAEFELQIETMVNVSYRLITSKSQ